MGWHRGVTRCSSRNRRRRHGALGFPNPLPCSAFQSLSGLHLGSVCTRSAWRAPGAIGLDPPWRVLRHRMRTVPSLIEGHACHRQGSHGDSLDNGCGVPDEEVGLPQLSMSEEVRMLPASTGRLEGSGSVRTRTILCPRRICTSLRFDPPGHVQQRLGSRAPTRTCALCVRMMDARELIV